MRLKVQPLERRAAHCACPESITRLKTSKETVRTSDIVASAMS